MNNNLNLFDEWAHHYDEEVDNIGGPLTNYRISMEKSYHNHSISGENILDIGVGTGNFISYYMDDFENAYATDISSNMLTETKQKFPSINVEVADFTHIPFKDNHFDLIISSFAFHEVPLSDRHIAMKEISRLLKPGGTVNLLDIGFNNENDLANSKEKHADSWDHTERYHFEKELIDYVKETDLVLSKIDYPSEMHINVIARKK